MKSVVPFMLIVLTTVASIQPLEAATKTWQGNNVSFAWSDPDNWNPPGVPQDGDDLVFQATVIASHFGLMINDLTNLSVGKLSFTVNALAGVDWQLTGNALTVREIRATHTDDEEVYINCPLKLGGPGRFEVGYGIEFFAEVGLHVNGPIDLNGFNLLLIEQFDGGDLDVSGEILGSGDVHILGGVELEGENPNIFVGTVYLHDSLELSPADLTLDKINGPAIPGPLIISNSCSVILQRPHQIADTTTVVIHPKGRLELAGNTETIAGLYLRGDASAVPRVDSDTATLSVLDNITAVNSHPELIPAIQGQLGLPLGAHVIHTSGSSDFALNIEARMVGEGGIIKRGDKGLLLSGNNSFAGDAVLEAGRVDVNHINGLGANSGGIFLDGGELHLNGVAVGQKTLIADRASPNTAGFGANLVASGVASWLGPVILNTNLVVNDGSMTFGGPISGPAGLYLFNAGTHLEGANPNTFEGTTFVFAPLLELNKPLGVRALGSKLEVHAGGGGNLGEVRWLQNYQCIGLEVTLFTDAFINLNGHRDDFGPVAFNGGAISTGPTGELGLYGLLKVNAHDTPALISGRLGLPPGLHEFRINDGPAFPDLRIDATVLGAGHLRKTGPGQLWLAAANTYEGLTTVAEGALSVLDPNGLGGPATGTTVQEGATLELNLVGTVPEPLALRGTGVSGQGALGVFGDVTLRNPLPSIFAPVDLTADTTIGVAPNSFLTVDGFISGVGALRKGGPGTLRFGGNDHNTYVGDTYIDEGIFIMAKPTGTTAVPGALSIGTSAGLPAVAGNVASYQVIGNIFVNRNGLLNLNGQVENVDHLWLTEGGDVQTTTGILFLKTGGSIQVVPGAVGELSTITGNLDMDAGDHVINVGASSGSGLASTVQLEIAALITSSLGNINLHKDGLGILRLNANNTYTGPTTVNAGVLQLDGTQSSSTFQVQNGGVLAGQGRAGNLNFLSSGNGSRLVSPGNATGLSAGVLRCVSFNSAGIGGVLRVELLGTSPGAGGYDRLHAMSRFATVRLDGVTLDARLHFASTVNDQFIIILNDGTLGLNGDTPKPVGGEFTGLPEGASLYIGGEQFTISYVGGDGNDVVLTRIPTPPRPVLTIEHLPPSSVRLLWATSSLPFSLQSNTNLNTTNWTTVSLPAVVVGTNNVTTDTATGQERFYRLYVP